MAGRKGVSYAELRVGIVVAIALIVAMATTIYVTREGGLPFLGGQYTVYSYLRDVNGLKAGAPIHLSGVEVGSVRHVEFAGPDAPAPVRVTLNLRTEVQERVTTNSLVTVGSLGVLGEKLLDIDPGQPGGVPIEDQGTVPGEAEGDPIKGIISDASTTMRDVRDLARDLQSGEGTLGALLKREELYQKLLELIGKAEDVFVALDRMEGTFGKMIHDPAIYDNLNELTENMKSLVTSIETGDGALGRLVHDESMGLSVKQATANLESVTRRVDQGEGTLGALVRDRALYDRLDSLSGNFDSISARLERGDGTAGQLLHDRALYENLNATAVELRGLLADIRQDPKKYLRIKVSLF
ncbi:MAG TPA: MlaD family protein [Vicinamibacteria bacterium]|nr:MlaD family protein [Vicinamibacteria bacterium]